MKRFICAFICLIVATSCSAMRVTQSCGDYDEHLISGVTQYYVLANKKHFIQDKSGYFRPEGGSLSIEIMQVIGGGDTNICIKLANGHRENVDLQEGDVLELPAGVGIDYLDNNSNNDVILRVKFERPLVINFNHQPNNLFNAHHYHEVVAA